MRHRLAPAGRRTGDQCVARSNRGPVPGECLHARSSVLARPFHRALTVAAGRKAQTVSAVDDILADVPMNQLAAQLGVDQATAEQAARQAIPALLGGLQANSEDPAGAMSLAGALGDHPSDLIDGGVDLNQVNANDGEKIVGNIFGPNQDQVAQTLGGNLGGQAGGLIKQLLPILAPIVLAYLSKRLRGQSQGTGGKTIHSARSWAAAAAVPATRSMIC